MINSSSHHIHSQNLESSVRDILDRNSNPDLSYEEWSHSKQQIKNLCVGRCQAESVNVQQQLSSYTDIPQ
ncbi:hypothetical protein PPL_09942 [Heterostelium album PN500]|uniref:Uncharacterized protein n=1 Tax=Heterostelium pallidum (strain ATCC 26659 / Pp 5 / PN500) TaxID=670386 RepID=D3BPL7_HETP5|nr:hypothetical protein PPL_09942 [Heterostelium album PN500]EFA76637.1 hypothetical protein PPL_09942 [Heterostelium album PN500]|eukprot:XP_020428769.1 hypothetical protein PPL_09942 [Heterostelium album PN500]